MGRPPKFSTDSTFPKPPQKQYQDVGTKQFAHKFFKYWETLPAEMLERASVVGFRIWPLHEKRKVDPEAPIEEFVWSGAPPCKSDDVYQYFLEQFGSGDWRLELHEEGVKGIVTRCFFGSHGDWETYPPKIDPRILIHGPFKNREFISWLEKQPGADLPWTKTPEQEEQKTEMTATSALVEALKDQANRADRQVEKLEEKIDELQAAATEEDPDDDDPEADMEPIAQSATMKILDTSLGMLKDQVSRVTAESAKSYNPIEVASSVLEMAKALKGSDGGNSEIFLKMIESQASEAKFWREKAIGLLSSGPAQTAVATQPKGLLEQMQEMAEFKSVARELFGTGGRERVDHDPPAAPSKNWMETFLESPIAAPLITTGLTLLANMVYNFKNPNAKQSPDDALKAALNGGAPAVVPTPHAESPAATLTPEQQQAKATLQFLEKIEKPFLAHFFDTDSQGLNGYTFAQRMHCEFVPDGPQTPLGRNQYLMIRDRWKEQFDQLLRRYPPIWEMVQGHGPRYQKFLGEFFDYDAEIARRDGDEEEPGKTAA